jgi:hypothetical protein
VPRGYLDIERILKALHPFGRDSLIAVHVRVRRLLDRGVPEQVRHELHVRAGRHIQRGECVTLIPRTGYAALSRVRGYPDLRGSGRRLAVRHVWC